ncbi:MAG: hypothetical protein HYS08_00830 [Chlamydiae bacterium]|nr:hypothetical protein [Chlamydiota bacterium]MBI3265666.1 hypothetical protein [Chlamydiota bacterium]
MLFDVYLKQGKLKHQTPHFKQIEKQIRCARCDLATAKRLIKEDSDGL